LWQGSHHALAMQPATEHMVLGDFKNTHFTYAQTTSTFFKHDNKFFVRTDGADGSLQAFEIKYTLGVRPLQQYLVEFPGGRLQALGIAWDSRPKEQGGQHWFHLYPNENITHTDELHWTRRSQNWNFMCAECHSTHLNKNYDAKKREYRTTWSELNVACEACHGPGSNHMLWATKAKGWQAIDGHSKGLTHRLDQRKGVRWRHDSASGKPVRVPILTTDTELQVCAACHSRRAQLFEDDRTGQPLMDSFLPALLDEGLYHADGQIDGEVYEYGSFIQSRMYPAGVSCSDCHEPHSLQLRKPGNSVCLQCHVAKTYDTQNHHFHPPGKPGARCVDCHMPSKNYMVIDARRDHSLRIPRPDLSERFGTPNACNTCHQDKPPAWATKKMREWYGHDPKSYQNYAEVLNAARYGTTDARAELVKLLKDSNQPAIARATAARELRNWLNRESFTPLVKALKDRDPMLRLNALESLRSLPPDMRWQLVRTLLHDPVRTVRISAAGLLAEVPLDQIPSSESHHLQRANEEFLAAQSFNADDPSAQVNLGNFYTAQAQAKLAEQAYRQALDLDPNWVPAYVNLADLYRQTGDDPEAEKLLQLGITRVPQAADLYHSLGLVQVRLKNRQAAMRSLQRAAELAPNEPRYSYVYAVALQDTGKTAEARRVVDEALKRIPGNSLLNELRTQLNTPMP
jgi:tetratricopeptide (TPR) repeat protein